MTERYWGGEYGWLLYDIIYLWGWWEVINGTVGTVSLNVTITAAADRFSLLQKHHEAF
jgi:hypothetical protein